MSLSDPDSIINLTNGLWGTRCKRETHVNPSLLKSYYGTVKFMPDIDDDKGMDIDCAMFKERSDTELYNSFTNTKFGILWKECRNHIIYIDVFEDENEIYKWCELNFGLPFYYCGYIISTKNRWAVDHVLSQYNFKNDEDAALFRLTWG